MASGRSTEGRSTEARTPARADAPRAQRVLAAMAFTLIGISAIAVVALLVLHAVGVPDTAFRTGGLAVLTLLPLPGLTLGLVLVIVSFVLVAVRRSRG